MQHLTLTVDPMGHVVTRTARGLARWDGSAWQEFDARNGLPDNPITAAVSDNDGNFWLAVSGVGLWRWHAYDNVESWTKNQGLVPESVWSIVRDRQHRLILGTDLGCRMLDEKTHLVVPCPYRGFPEAETNASAVDPVWRAVAVLPDFAAVARAGREHPGAARDHGAGPLRCRGDAL